MKVLQIRLEAARCFVAICFLTHAAVCRINTMLCVRLHEQPDLLRVRLIGWNWRGFLNLPVSETGGEGAHTLSKYARVTVNCGSNI